MGSTTPNPPIQLFLTPLLLALTPDMALPYILPMSYLWLTDAGQFSKLIVLITDQVLTVTNSGMVYSL